MASQTKAGSKTRASSSARKTSRSSRMTSMSIAVPTSMKKAIESRVKAGGYGNVSEYVRELIRNEPAMRHAYIEARLVEGAKSGPPVEATEELWARLRQLSKVAAAEGRKKP